MDEHLLRLYLGQVKAECEAAFNAIQGLNAALQSPEEASPFPSAQALVHHAAAVSRMFWPPGSRNKQAKERAALRGETLRNAICLTTPHPVQSRTLRDHFEHFDERLDAWAEASKHRNIIKQLVGTRAAVGGDGVEDGDIIHHYDPATKVYAFRGEKFDVQDLATGLSDIYEKVKARFGDDWPYV